MKFNLVTRGDFDGIICSVFFKEVGLVDKVIFEHPFDVQENKININKNTILCHLPYHKDAFLVLDNHQSELIRNKNLYKNHIFDRNAPSSSQIVYDFINGEKFIKNKNAISLLNAVNKSVQCQFSALDIRQPEKYDLLNFLLDPRTGIGRFHDFSISNQEMMQQLINDLQICNINEILSKDYIKERIDFFNKNQVEFETQIKSNLSFYHNIAIIDLSNLKTIYPGNRFLIFALYPNTKYCIYKIQNKDPNYINFAIGKSVLNSFCLDFNIGEFLVQYGGGGHKHSGTCQIKKENSKKILEEIILELDKF